MNRVQLDVDDDLMAQAATVWQTFNLARVPLYRRYGVLMEVSKYNTLVPVNKGRLIELLVTCLELVRNTRGGPQSAGPRSDLIAMLLDSDAGVPDIRRIAYAPTFLPDGTIQKDPGYWDGVLYIDSGIRKGMEFDPHPDDNQIIEAAETLNDVVVDFPFVEDCDKAHALSLMFLPFVRDMIDGPTPMHIIESPVSNTGKSLLGKALLYPALGKFPVAGGFSGDEEERRKALTAALMGGNDVLFFDDVSGSLRSNVMHRALTSDVIQDRVLGSSKTATMQMKAIWVLTSNNARISSEIGRRSVRVRLDAKMAQPGLRDYTSYRHPDVREWLGVHRSDIVWSILTLVNAWKADGMSGTGRAPLPGFEQWSYALGGITKMCGAKGWLEHTWAEEDVDELTEFVSAWWSAFGGQTVKASALQLVAVTTGFLERNQGSRALGIKLAQHRDNIVAGWVLRDRGRTNEGRMWALESVSRASEVTPQ